MGQEENQEGLAGQVSREPEITEREELGDAAGLAPVDPKIKDRRLYYARKILSLFDEPGMNVSKAARELGKSRQSLYVTMRSPWFLAEQKKWHSKIENRKEVARQISMASALDDLHLRFAAMLEECANVLEAGLKSEDERVKIDCAKTIIEKAEEAAPENSHGDTEDSLLGQIDKFLPEGTSEDIQ